jgi:hypothetical protein
LLFFEKKEIILNNFAQKWWLLWREEVGRFTIELSIEIPSHDRRHSTGGKKKRVVSTAPTINVLGQLWMEYETLKEEIFGKDVMADFGDRKKQLKRALQEIN